MSAFKYRPDIDGMRAIAVLLVLVFHAFPTSLPGGYIGVDVFFVISGFLISSIILHGLQEGTFTFTSFYMRRIRRLFPALVVVLGFCLVVGWVVLLADEYQQLGKHVIGGAAFVSNFLLWREAGYFDKAAELKPLLHLWSLGVEEQFYMFWPLLLWAVIRFRAPLALVLGITVGASFALSLWQVSAGTVGAFFSPAARLWELGVGALLALAPLHRVPRMVREWLGIAGVLLLAAGLLTITPQRMFPGTWAVLPVSAALLLITAEGSSISRALAARPLVWVGLISFPLYLWHAPLLVFGRIMQNGEPSPELRLALLLSAAGLAWATYVLIERPLRGGEKGRAKAAGLTGAMAVVGVLGALVFASGGGPERPIATATATITAALNDSRWPFGLRSERVGDVEIHTVGTGPLEVLVYGDSHSQHFAPRLEQLATEERARPTAFLTDWGCSPIPGVLEDKHRDCDKKSANVAAVLAAHPSIDTIMVAACWNCYFLLQTRPTPIPGDPYSYYVRTSSGIESFREGNGSQRAMEALQSFLFDLGQKRRVYLLLDNPLDFAFEPQRMAADRLSLKAVNQSPVPLQVAQIVLNDRLRILGAAAGVTVIDQLPALCPDGLCVRVSAPNVPAYRDSHHLRPHFALERAAYLDPVWSIAKLP